MYKLILADGTELDVGLCGNYDGGPVYIEVYNSTILDLARILSDPTKTVTMLYDYKVGRNTFDGFTELARLELAGDVINVTMRRPQK